MQHQDGPQGQAIGPAVYGPWLVLWQRPLNRLRHIRSGMQGMPHQARTCHCTQHKQALPEALAAADRRAGPSRGHDRASLQAHHKIRTSICSAGLQSPESVSRHSVYLVTTRRLSDADDRAEQPCMPPPLQRQLPHHPGPKFGQRLRDSGPKLPFRTPFRPERFINGFRPERPASTPLARKPRRRLGFGAQKDKRRRGLSAASCVNR